MATSDKGMAAAGQHTQAAQPEMGNAVVAAGHTVIGDDGKAYAPGETVPLTVQEIERLTLLGFLKDEAAAAEESAAKDGPTLKQEGGGPTVTKGTK